MDHRTRTFFYELKKKFPEFFTKNKVLDVGSLNINGTLRDYFEDCEYIGLDLAEGNNVDVVSLAHEYNESDESFNVIVSAGTFEHDIYYEKTLRKIMNLLESKGLLAFGCGTKECSEHGTSRNKQWASPNSSILFKDYYKNLFEEDIRKVIDIDNIFRTYEFSTVKNLLFFWGIKK